MSTATFKCRHSHTPDLAGYAAGVEPDTQYARVDKERVAYQVVGEGPLDLVMSAGTYGSIDLDWEDPMVAGMYRRMAAFSRLIRFDRRGSGASDPLPLDALPSWESYIDEVVAVMEAVGSERAAIMGLFDAGPMATLLAATRPDRTAALILANTSARILASEDYPGAPPSVAEAMIDRVEQTWGTEEQARMQVPSRASDERFRRWFARYTRSIAGPTAVRAYLRAMLDADARSILSSVHVPTLVLHRKHYPLFRIEQGQYLAEHIEGARFFEIPGSDGPLPWENADLVVDLIEEFLTGVRRGAEPGRAVATVLFTDIVSSTERAGELGDERWLELLNLHYQAAYRVAETFRGRVVQTTGDGVLATFDGPRRGIRASIALRDELLRIGLEIRSGIHTGEVELRDEDVGGMAVHIAARVMAAAGAGEIIVSRTVRDLIVGSEIKLEERGEHALKGVEGNWQLFAVVGA
jgi:class 3 adenylate cyclase